VLFIVNSLDIGGAEKHTIGVLNGLDPSRFQASLAWLKRGDALLREVARDRVSALIPCKGGGRFDLNSVRRLADFIARENVHTIVCTNTYSTLYGYLARRYSGRAVRLISVYHTTLLRSRKEKLQHLLYRWMLRRCELLVYVCERQRAYWRSHRLRARDEQVIHNGVDADYYADSFTPQEKADYRRRAGFSPDDYVIGLCATFRPEKAVEDLIKAVAALRIRGLPAKALLIGDGPHRARIESVIQDLALGEHVCITGYQSDVRPWIASADVMTLVSHSIETFSLAGLEAMALGKPLVMSDIGGADEEVVAGVTGFLFAPGDIDALIQHLAELSSPAVRARMGIAARERVCAHFTLRRMQKAFESILLPPPDDRQAHRPRHRWAMHSSPSRARPAAAAQTTVSKDEHTRV
jgi:glycosyltransferase involved in cell wall biosynthesis